MSRPDPHARLAELGIALPAPATPVASYLPSVLTGHTLYVSGQLPLEQGELLAVGKVGAEVTPEQATAAARQCGVNILAVVEAAVGLRAVRRVVKLGGFVASAPGFTGQPGVINGASNLMTEVFDEAGLHARVAVGAAELPLNSPVEVDAVFEVAHESSRG